MHQSHNSSYFTENSTFEDNNDYLYVYIYTQQYYPKIIICFGPSHVYN